MLEHHQPIFLSGVRVRPGTAVDDEQGDAAEAGAAGADGDGDEVGAHARGDEHLAAVDDEVVAVGVGGPARGGLEVGDVGAAGGFADGEGGDLAAGEDIGDEALLLLVVAEVDDWGEADAVAEQAGDEAAVLVRASSSRCGSR